MLISYRNENFCKNFLKKSYFVMPHVHKVAQTDHKIVLIKASCKKYLSLEAQSPSIKCLLFTWVYILPLKYFLNLYLLLVRKS